jgi:hypothetical protein
MQDPVAENKPQPPNQSVMQDHNYCTSQSCKSDPKIEKISGEKKKDKRMTSKNLRKEKTVKGLVKKLENA